MSVSCERCALLGGGLCVRRADHSSRVVLPSKVCLKIIEDPQRTKKNRAVVP